MAWIKDVLVAKRKWTPQCRYEIYVRGLKKDFPHRWYRLDGAGGFYDECFFITFPSVDWKFFERIEEAEIKLQLLNGA